MSCIGAVCQNDSPRPVQLDLAQDQVRRAEQRVDRRAVGPLYRRRQRVEGAEQHRGRVDDEERLGHRRTVTCAGASVMRATPMNSRGSGGPYNEESNRGGLPMNVNPTAEIDTRFSDPDAGPTPWSETLDALERAELYWISTV